MLQSNLSFASQIFVGSGDGINDTLSYDTYSSNARRGEWSDWKVTVSPRDLQEWDVETLSHSISGGEWTPSSVKELFGIDQRIPGIETTNNNKRSAEQNQQRNGDTQIFQTNSNCEDGDGIIDLVDTYEMKTAADLTSNTPSSPRKRQNEHLGATDTICLDSDSDVEVCDSSFVKSSSRKRVRLDDDVIEVVNLENDPPRGKDKLDATTTVNDADNKVVDSTETRKKSPLFLILHCWGKYDQSVGQLLDKYWRNTFSSHDGDFDEFSEKAVLNLTCVVLPSIFPIVHRKTLMVFELWLQLIVGVHVRSVQRLEFAIEIRNRLDDSTSEKVASVPCRKLLVQCTPSQSSIDKNISTPLRNKFISKTSSKPYIDELESSTRNKESDSIRRARLRRFEKPSPTPPHVRANLLMEHRTSDRWSCADCTYLNAATNEFCAICDAVRNPNWACTYCNSNNSASSIACFQCCKLKESSSDFLVRSAQSTVFGKMQLRTWCCSYCTHENAHDISKCVQCGKTNDCAGDIFVSSNEKFSTGNLWTCLFCTWKNSSMDTNCFQCRKIKSSRSDNGDMCASSSNPSASLSSITWSCPHCTTENTMEDIRCLQCGNSENIIPTANITTSAASSTFDDLDEPPKRRIRCGACGKEGHNRSNATESNCPAYFDENEIERREIQKMKKKEALERERKKMAELKREEETDEKSYADWLKQTEELKKKISKSAEYRKGELKRIEKKVQRMEKRQNMDEGL